MVPVFINEMGTRIFIISGLLSLAVTLGLAVITYSASPGTRLEIHLGKLFTLILSIYTVLNVFYYFSLIPPVPLALQSGIVAHHVELKNNKYVVSYEADESLFSWRDYRSKFVHRPEDNIYIFSSIFAPTDLKKSVFHRWKWYNEDVDEWMLVEDIGYDILGGRDGGFRGYTHKNNVKQGKWRVEVITEEELVLGIIDFEIIIDPEQQPKKLTQLVF